MVAMSSCILSDNNAPVLPVSCVAKKAHSTMAVAVAVLIRFEGRDLDEELFSLFFSFDRFFASFLDFMMESYRLSFKIGKL